MLITKAEFPSPHSGILFLLQLIGELKPKADYTGFRPLIRGFFFYWFFMSIMLIIAAAVSVPLFRDSFLFSKAVDTIRSQ